MRSLRARLTVGAVLWSAGLVVITNLIAMSLLRHGRPGPFVHVVAMSVLAAGLLATGLTFVRVGMSPVVKLRARLAALRAGTERRVAGRHPLEVQALVDDLNALLDEREEAVTRAQAHAGNLAHGLKTPLAVLAQEAERAAASGATERAAEIAQQVERMRRQVEYHLAHARAAASAAGPGTRCAVAESAEGLARTLRRLYAERALSIETTVPAEISVRCQRADLDEMLGNLLDNACQWARTRVAVSASSDGGRVLIRVDDDGPGLEPSLRTAVLQRGVRADEAAPGSGLGLAIVRDLAALYGGSVALAESPHGGLRATLELPATTPSPS